ncbi:MAG TPA: ferritin-like domain-containing protein [Segetibacter sp.]|jgi:hypothetical protein
MNLQNVLTEIEKVDPEVYNKLDTRRRALKGFAGIGKRLSLAALPIAFGTFFKKAYGQPAGSKILEIFNYALLLEYLEAEFYKAGVANFGAIGVPAGAAQGAITTIRDHENAHVAFLRGAITANGGMPITRTAANFDFTARGTFTDVFSNYATFLAVAQTFEDTGVRAYKGRAAELTRGGDLLTAALNIHSVEARHASHIRQMRRNSGQSTTAKPWITQNRSDIASSAVQASYNGEEITTQGQPGVQITGINGQTIITADAASEAFDEGLTPDQVTAIITPFLR